MNNAYITFLSSDNYIYYIISLYDSWKQTQSKYPFYCCVTQNVGLKTIQILKKIGCPYIRVNTLPLDNVAMKGKKMCRKYQKAFGKLIIFSLDQFDKCIFLDSDLVIKQNIDELFNKPDFSAVEDCLPVHKRPNKYQIGESSFNSGMFVFSPSKAYYLKICKTLISLPSNIKWHDQAVLSYLNQDWMQRDELHLPYVYNTLVAMQEKVMDKILELYGTFDDIKVFHYVTYKNAPYSSPALLDASVYQYYYDYFKYINDVIKKYNLPLESIHLRHVVKKT